MSFDEARNGFTRDADPFIEGRTPAPSDTVLVSDLFFTEIRDGVGSIFDTGDAYVVQTEIGDRYRFTADVATIFGSNGAAFVDIDVIDANLEPITVIASDSVEWTAETDFYIVEIGSTFNPEGFYQGRVTNLSRSESDGSLTVLENTIKQGSLDFVGDGDDYSFLADEGVTYEVRLISSIPDLVIDMETERGLLIAPDQGSVTDTSFRYTAESLTPVVFEVYSESFRNVGDYSFVVDAVNFPSTGFLVVTGDTAQGGLLEILNSVEDRDGLGDFSFQWLRDGASIVGATEPTYRTTQADVGAAISVVGTYTDGAGNLESVTSAETDPVENLNDAPGGALTIEGLARQGQTLSAANGLTDADGLGDVAFRWLRDGAPIDGATGGAYTLTQADVGAEITVEARYVDGFGFAEVVTSAATDPVANANDAPTGSVSIVGVAREDETLSVAQTLGDVEGLGPFSFRWLRNGQPIAGALGDRYTLTQSDVGARISAEISYTDGFGTLERVESARTEAVENVNDAPTGAVDIAGEAEIGGTLSAVVSLRDADGLGDLSYRWFRDGAPIPDATSATYDVVVADAGAALTVETRYVDSFGVVERATSAATPIPEPEPTVIIDPEEPDPTPNRGGPGEDTLDGGTRPDSLVSGAGDDVVRGDAGDDTLKSGGGDDRVEGGAGADVILGGNGDDLIFGGAGDDNIKPGRGDDVVIGGDGDDVVAGFRGDERFEGGEGRDRLLGSVDDDTLIGGSGDDRLWGGPGFDVFVFEDLDFGTDTLPLDFRIGSDRLDFTAVDGLTQADFSIRQVGANVVLEVGEGMLIMNGVRFGGLDAGEMIDRFDEVVLL